MSDTQAVKASIAVSPYERFNKEKDLKCFHGFQVKPITPNFVLSKDIIYQGNYGVKIYKAKCTSCNFPFVVKKHEGPEAADKEQAEFELRNLMHIKELKHKNIIAFFGSIKQNQKRLLFFELADISLANFVYQNARKLRIPQLNEILFQIFEMLDHLDRIQLYHNDFNAMNMVVFLAEGTIKLIDFGISKTSQDEGYKPPLSDLKDACFNLSEFQLLMHYQSRRDPNYKKASDEFNYHIKKDHSVQYDSKVNRKPETLLSNSSNWLPELPHKTRELLIDGFSTDIEKQKGVLRSGQRISTREKLGTL